MRSKTVIHLVYCFDIGGLETVLVNLINSLPQLYFEHIIISLTYAKPEFVQKLKYKVQIIELNKSVGNDFSIHLKLFNLFRHFKPDILHTYNIATVEYQLIAALVGIKRRIHAEHGRDIYDLTGNNRKYQLLRRFLNPFIHNWVAVSEDLSNWLIFRVKIPVRKVKLIYNGIDIEKYPINQTRLVDSIFTIVTIGRLAAVKDQLTLIKAIEFLVSQYPELRCNLKLIVYGDGELKSMLNNYVIEHNLTDCVQLPGYSYNVVFDLSQADLFILPSLAEGISLTLLEAMASSLPIIATNVGGNPELINSGINGQLVPIKSEQLISESIYHYMANPELRMKHGAAARAKVETLFNVAQMTKNYFDLYLKIST